MDYPLLTPPRELESFPDLGPGEAADLFEWFVSQEDERVSLLSQAFEAEVGLRASHDKHGLGLLWAWIARCIEVVPAETAPINIHGMSIPNRQLSSGSLALAIDLGFFIATLLRSNNPCVHWMLWTKSKDYYFQKPVLAVQGGRPFIPSDPVIAEMWKVVRGERNDQALITTIERIEDRLSKECESAG